MNAGMDDRQTVGRGFRRTTNQLPRIRIRQLNPSQLNRIDENGDDDIVKVIIKTKMIRDDILKMSINK